MESASSISAAHTISADIGSGVSIAALSDGTILATWASPNAQVMVQQFNQAGQGLTGATAIPSANLEVTRPTVNSLSTGGGFVTWQDASTKQFMGATVSVSGSPAPAPVPTSGADGLTPSLGLAALPVIGYAVMNQLRR